MQITGSDSEGNFTYVILEDGRTLRSPELGDKNCARIHAEQIVKLGLTYDFITRVLQFGEVEL